MDGRSLRSSVAMALGACLMLSIPAVAQDGADDVVVPELDGLAWHQSFDLAGPEMGTALPESDVTAWGTLAERAGASLDELRYTFQSAYDPSALPELGSVGTVRVLGVEADTLREAVVADMVEQAVGLGYGEPAVEEAMIGGKDVVIVSLPEEFGFDSAATIYAHGDTAWALILDDEQVVTALDQLP